MQAKFKVGDKVRLTSRAPQYWMRGRRKRARTVVAVAYSEDSQATIYELGDRGKGIINYPFRSYQLTPVNGTAHIIGRPRTHRKYQLRTKLLIASSEPILGGGIASQASNISQPSNTPQILTPALEAI